MLTIGLVKITWILETEACGEIYKSKHTEIIVQLGRKGMHMNNCNARLELLMDIQSVVFQRKCDWRLRWKGINVKEQ